VKRRRESGGAEEEEGEGKNEEKEDWGKVKTRLGGVKKRRR
jgi:hypothetical protein